MLKMWNHCSEEEWCRLVNLQPNQNSPMGRQIAPTIMGGRRSSGMDFPCLLKARVKFVAVL